MLVLSRKIGEAIMVGDHIRITVENIRGRQVRLGIVAPDEVAVDRQEVHEKRMNERDEWAEPEIWSYSWPETP
jgi:carbon storage regulator